MKKLLTCCLLSCSILILPSCEFIHNDNNNTEYTITTATPVPHYSRTDIALKAMDEKLAERETKENKKEWFIEYKELYNEYSDVLEYQPVLADFYTTEEIQKLYGVVEAEVDDLGGFDERCNVVSVIFNRVANERFSDKLSDLLIPRQFSTIKNGRYKTMTITDDTILACQYVLLFGDTAQGCLFFEGGKSNIHSKYATYIFTDRSGHKFYK